MKNRRTSAHDVAAYIVKRHGALSAMKLQKLVYYSQAWSLVWDEKPLFPERIEAWANGPVVPELYEEHRGKFVVSRWPKGDASQLTQVQRDTVNGVLGFYGSHSAQWLSDLTHSESPWRNARKGMGDGERGNQEITLASLDEYYSSI
jgi:uncharacterized phage-associated protein